MKISAVNNVSINNSNNKANNPSFKGVSDTLVKFWQFVDNGGRAVQFTVEDMCGTNLPRTYKGAMAGYKYTKKVNVAALLQEAFREFLTGPTMCLTPFAIINIVKKTFGKTSDTHIENIKNLSYIMDKLQGTPKEELDENFIKSVVSDMITKTSGKEALTEDVELLSRQVLDYKSLYDRLGMSKKELKDLNLTKPSKKDISDSMSGIGSAFEGIIKRTKDSFADTNFLHTKYSISDTAVGSTKTTNYVNYVVNYLNDFKKALNKDNSAFTSDFVQNFKSSWLNKRLGIVGAMVIVTGFLMSFVPKIYTKVSGNVNPNAKTIYNEAAKLPNNGKKEVSA